MVLSMYQGHRFMLTLVVNAAKLMEQNSDGIEIGRNKVGIIHRSTHSLMTGLMNYVAKR